MWRELERQSLRHFRSIHTYFSLYLDFIHHGFIKPSKDLRPPLNWRQEYAVFRVLQKHFLAFGERAPGVYGRNDWGLYVELRNAGALFCTACRKFYLPDRESRNIYIDGSGKWWAVDPPMDHQQPCFEGLHGVYGSYPIAIHTMNTGEDDSQEVVMVSKEAFGLRRWRDS